MKKCIIRFDENHTYEVTLDGDNVSINKIEKTSEATTKTTTRKTSVKKGE